MPRLSVTLQDRWGDSVTLCYEIYDHDLAVRWQQFTVRELQRLHKIHSVFHNQTRADLPQIEQQLSETVQQIDRIQRTQLWSPDLDQAQLNRWHYQFELFEQSQPQDCDPQLVDLWLLLNTQIHQWESAAKITASGPGSFGLLYDINHGGCRGEIHPQDLIWAEPNLAWGGLYLGYNTIGKDWLSCYLDDDRALIHQRGVKPQQQFSTETFLSFSTGVSRPARILDFQRWWRNLPPHLQDQVPMGDLNRLGLGKFRIGELIIDQQFLDLDPDPWHWQVQGHPCRQLWNHVVFRSLRSIKEIKILA
jgi:hypothetical protein